MVALLIEVATDCKRSVRFDDNELCIYHGGAIVDLIDSNREIWYQHNDLSHFKRKAMVVSKEAQRYGFGSLLTNTYGNATAETQEALNTWSRSANNRRGLERWINEEYSAKRSDIRRRTIQSVLRAQQKMRQDNINDADYTIKVLSRLSEAFSQDSRNFAHAMGKADAFAVQFVDQSPFSSGPSNDKLRRAPVRTMSNERLNDKLHTAQVRTLSPTSVVINRTPWKNVGLSGESDFRNFV